MLTHLTWFYMNLLREPQDLDVVPWSASMLIFMAGLSEYCVQLTSFSSVMPFSVAGIVQLFYAWYVRSRLD